MSLHINRFVDRLKALEQRGTKDFTMPMQDAKDLHADITKLLLQLQDMHEAKNQTPETVTIELTGGSF